MVELGSKLSIVGIGLDDLDPLVLTISHRRDPSIPSSILREDSIAVSHGNLSRKPVALTHSGLQA